MTIFIAKVGFHGFWLNWILEHHVFHILGAYFLKPFYSTCELGWNPCKACWIRLQRFRHMGVYCYVPWCDKGTGNERITSNRCQECLSLEYLVLVAAGSVSENPDGHLQLQYHQKMWLCFYHAEFVFMQLQIVSWIGTFQNVAAVIKRKEGGTICSV